MVTGASGGWQGRGGGSSSFSGPSFPLWRLGSSNSLSIFGNKARATNFLRVLFLYKCFFFVVVERGDIRFFEIVNSEKKKKEEKNNKML